MGKDSKISWCDHTWNCWYGCHRRTVECKNCYMFREQKRYGRDPSVVTRSKTTFNDPLKWKDPSRVFVCSWSDFWIEEADPWRAEAWDVMRQAPQHTYIIPTKRPENIMDRLPADWGDGWPNVWLLVSAGTVHSYQQFYPVLREIPAAVHGISIEPMLEFVDLGLLDWQSPPGTDEMFLVPTNHRLDWVIIGCESMTGKRVGRLGEFQTEAQWLDAAMETVDQCVTAGVKVYCKQVPIDGRVSTNPAEWPELLRRQEYPR